MPRTSKRQRLGVPNSVKIGSVNYSIDFVPDLRDDDGERLTGQHDYNVGVIRLDDAVYNMDILHNTLMHEVLHGIWAHQSLPTANEEEYVSSIANGLTMVLKDNPKLLELFK